MEIESKSEIKVKLHLLSTLKCQLVAYTKFCHRKSSHISPGKVRASIWQIFLCISYFSSCFHNIISDLENFKSYTITQLLQKPSSLNLFFFFCLAIPPCPFSAAAAIDCSEPSYLSCFCQPLLASW